MSDRERLGDRPRRTRVAPLPGPGTRDDGPGRSWLEDDGVTDRSGEFGTELVNLGYIGASLRRSKRLWAGLALVGFLLGVAFWAGRPPSPQASTTLILTVGPEGQPGTAILTDQAIAHSRGVARIAVHKLHLSEGVDGLLGTYKAQVVTDRVLRITVSAPSDGQAVTWADAIASAFLSFRADQLLAQQKLQFAALDEAVTQGEQQVKSIQERIAALIAQPSSSSQQAELRNLQASRDQAANQLAVLKDGVESAKASAQETTAAMIGQSKVLDAASPVAQSRLKPLVLFSGAGLIVGLFLGAGIAIVRGLVSDRLRRRDDVALALGAPVRLSIAAKPASRWRPGRHDVATTHRRDMQRIVAFLRGTLPAESPRGALAVVPVDDTRIAASSVVLLAASLAKNGARVIVADVCPGSPVAKLLEHKEPGVHTVEVEGARIELAVPDTGDIAPVGPLITTEVRDEPTLAGELTAAYASADVLLTLIALDPSLASDHLRTWATEAVVTVTAGKSSWTRIHAVSELIRLAGTRLTAAVLLGADKWDESLGVRATSGARRDGHMISGSGATEHGPFADPAVLKRPGVSKGSGS